ncbi:MAG TPA: histidine kinase [Myxococcaceae bacterium]|nr:histidine kinase [Myxococcaceae bacterium]
MIPVALTRPFARRLLPLVLVASGLFAVVVPLAHHLDARSRAVVRARERGERVAHVLAEAVRDRPLLWRYDAAKVSGRLQQEALLGEPLIVRDRENRPVPLGSPGSSAVAWARVPVEVEGVPVATVWSGAPLPPLWQESVRLLAGCLLLASALGALLFLFPVRTVARAEERIAVLLAERRVALQDEERRRIARELHDGAGQALTAARLQLLALRKRGLAPEDATQVEHHLDEALEEVRRSTSALLPAPLATLGFLGALRKHCASYARATGVDISLDAPDELPELPPPMAAGLYRIVQEALHNTVRHAGAARASVRVSHLRDALSLEFDDDGRGFPDQASSQSIRERVAGLGGAVDWPDPGRSHLRVRVPLGGATA